MRRSVLRARHNPHYWSSWGLSAGTHTLMVGLALILSHALPVPKKVERNPITVSFVTPKLTQPRTTPVHRPTVKRPPLTPTTQTTLVQPKPMPKEPTQSKPRTQTQTRQSVSPRTVVQPSLKPSSQPLARPTGVTRTSTAQPKTVVQAQASSQPRVRNGAVSSHPVARPVGRAATQPRSRSIGTTRQQTAAVVHASAFHREQTHTNAMTAKVHPVAPRNPIVQKKVIRAPAMEAVKQTPRVAPKASHAERVHGSPKTVRQRVSRPHQIKPSVGQNSSRTVRQRVSRPSENSVVRTRTTTRHVHQTRRTSATISRPVSTDGFSPALLAFSKLLREKIAQALEFPRLARRLGYSGTTHVVITLSKNGIVQALTISQPSGYEVLDKAAVATLKKVLPTVEPPESIDVAQLAIPIAFNLKQ